MFRFTLRDLFLVTVCVAFAAGWWMDRRRILAQNHYLTYQHTELQARFDRMKANRDKLLADVREFQAAMQVIGH